MIMMMMKIIISTIMLNVIFKCNCSGKHIHHSLTGNETISPSNCPGYTVHRDLSAQKHSGWCDPRPLQATSAIQCSWEDDHASRKRGPRHAHSSAE